jgi:hypothetical protein
MSDIDPAQIQNLMNSLNLTSAQAEDVARSLGRLSQSSRGAANAADAQRDATGRLISSYDSLKTGFSGLGQGIGSAAQGINTLTSSVGSTRDMFMALIPSINFAHDIFNKLVLSTGGFASALTQAAEGLPSLFGKIAGAMHASGETFKKVILAAGDIAFNAAKTQVSETQKLVNEFKAMADAGMTFGGSFEAATAAAHAAGVSMETFSSFASKSAANLALIGTSSQSAAGMIMKMAKDVSPGLMDIYGSMDNIASEMANYVALQTGLGVDAVKNQKELEEGAKRYLLNEREMSNLTGKKVDQLRQEEKQRQQSAAYQLKMQELDPAQQANQKFLFDMLTKQYGELGSRMAMNQLLNGDASAGNPDLMRLESQVPKLFETVNGMARNINLDSETFKRTVGETLASSADPIKDQIKGLQPLLTYAASGIGNDIFNQLNKLLAPVLGSYSEQVNSPAAVAASIQNFNAAMSNTGSMVDSMTAAIEKMKRALEGVTIQNLDMVSDAITLATGLIKPDGAYVEALGTARKLFSALADPTDANKWLAVLDKLGKDLTPIGDTIGGTVAPPRRPDDPTPRTHPIEQLTEKIEELIQTIKNWSPIRTSSADADLPVLASASRINRSPTPETDPVLLALQDQNRILEDVAQHSKDTVDMQGKILNALA